jgi:membrane dipeptidase
VIGMSAAPHTTLSHAHPLHTIESVMDHVRYGIDLVGIEHVAFGPDTLYGDHVGLHTVVGHLMAVCSATAGWAHEEVACVDGLENPTEDFAHITGGLVQHGLRDDEVRAVVGGNVLRALRDTWVR